MPTDHELALKSLHYRRNVLRWIKHAGAGHTGGSLSCVDILNVLYNRILRVSPATFADPQRDRYIQSKGHSVEALFVVLADCGFFPSRISKRFVAINPTTSATRRATSRASSKTPARSVTAFLSPSAPRSRANSTMRASVPSPSSVMVNSPKVQTGKAHSPARTTNWTTSP